MSHALTGDWPWWNQGACDYAFHNQYPFHPHVTTPKVEPIPATTLPWSPYGVGPRPPTTVPMLTVYCSKCGSCPCACQQSGPEDDFVKAAIALLEARGYVVCRPR